ncbi:MAG: aminotransferase class I/II-fold pyridoxal phosphate-dependent enzyme [Vulcanimicrobiota bacterium]
MLHTSSPRLSQHMQGRKPSAIRIAGIRFDQRQDDTQALNVAIGNVSLPMHPAMRARLASLGGAYSPFADGVVKYTGTVGTQAARDAFLNIIASTGNPTEGLHCQITDGGSQAMELIIVATCGPAGSEQTPLLLIDAAYTNYKAFANRLGRATVSVSRDLRDDGFFSLPSMEDIEKTIVEHRPGALVVIPYDNPTGALYSHEAMVDLARLCVKHDLWLISDEAYRELFYEGEGPVSVWGITEAEVPGITGRRVSIETASKVWNACGLRIGALVTDNLEFHTQCVAENTASLCSNTLGQYIFSALGELDHAELRQWYDQQRSYYKAMLTTFSARMKELLPGVIVSRPDASIYSVIDVRKLAKPGFDALEFVLWCASEGAVEREDGKWTLLTAPMAGFYSPAVGAKNPGLTQMRVAFVEPPERMLLVPDLFAALFTAYEATR